MQPTSAYASQLESYGDHLVSTADKAEKLKKQFEEKVIAMESAHAKWKKAEQEHTDYMKEEGENNFDNKEAFRLSLQVVVTKYLLDQALKETKDAQKKVEFQLELTKIGLAGGKAVIRHSG